MYCNQKIMHTIQYGDSLYHLSEIYNTTVQGILSLNPQLDPYNLQVGSQIQICLGSNSDMENGNNILPLQTSCNKKMILSDSMRLVWEQHVYWTRMLLISIASYLNDQNDVTRRLLRNPWDIAEVFGEYYSTNIVNTIARLLTEHLQIGAAIITSLRDHQNVKADELTRQWYENADKIAYTFSRINPYYNLGELSNMLYQHLELTTEEVKARLAEDYTTDIKAFDEIEQQALDMADYFSSGIIKQFPEEFK